VLTGADTPAQLSSDESIFFDDVNIHIYSFDVYYGGGDAVARSTQGAAIPNCSTALANAILTFRNIRISTIWFKNRVNLSNAVVIATGTIIKPPV
jgi:hypothetical protein